MTLRNHAICIKLRCNLHLVTLCFDANSVMISVRLQCKMIKMEASKP